MESLTTMRTIKVSRKDANNFRLKGLVDRIDLACPGSIIALKDVSYGKAVKMIKTGTMDVLTPGTKDEWTHIPNGDYNALTEAYTDKNTVVKEEPEIIITNEPVEEDPVEEVEDIVDESDDEDTVDESDIEETIEDDITEDEQKVEEVTGSDNIEEDEAIEETPAVDEVVEPEEEAETVEETNDDQESVVTEQPTVKTVSNNNQKYQYTYKKKKNKK